MAKSKNFSSPADYIANQGDEMRTRLEVIRNTVRKLVPDAEEVISYSIPAFRLHGLLMHYAAFKNHYSFFFGPEVTKAFLGELKEYKTSKSAINIPAEKAVPVRLLSRMTKYAVKLQKEKEKAKIKTGKKK